MQGHTRADDLIEDYCDGSACRTHPLFSSNHCTYLGGPLQEHVATTYGVVRDSILNKSRFFHVTEGLAPDIMHDVLEGALTKELIKYANLVNCGY